MSVDVKNMIYPIIVTLFIVFLILAGISALYESIISKPQEKTSFLAERLSYASQRTGLYGVSDWELDKGHYIVQIFGDSECMSKLDPSNPEGIPIGKYYSQSYEDNYLCENLFCLCVFSTVEENAFFSRFGIGWFDKFKEIDADFDSKGLMLEEQHENGLKYNGKGMCDMLASLSEDIAPKSLACFPINYGGIDTALVYNVTEDDSDYPEYAYVSAISGVEDELAWAYADFMRDTYFGGSEQQQILMVSSVITE